MPDKKTVYDSIISRLRSGRDSKNEKELREAFKNILKQLEKQKMLTSEGKNWLHKRIPKDFKLTSDMVNSTGKRHLDRVYKVHMRKKASVLGGMLKKAENEKGKKRNIQRAIAKKAPLLGLAGAGFGTGYDVQNRYRGMALGGLAGAGLGAAAGYSQGKLSNKLRKRKVEKYENMPESDFRNELGLSVALSGASGHGLGKILAPMGHNIRLGKEVAKTMKDYAEFKDTQNNRRENSIDIDDYDLE
jgi:hypothetical protein